MDEIAKKTELSSAHLRAAHSLHAALQSALQPELAVDVWMEGRQVLGKGVGDGAGCGDAAEATLGEELDEVGFGAGFGEDAFPQRLAGQDLVGEEVAELLGDLVLASQEEALERPRADLDGVHRAEDPLESEPVSGESHDASPDRQSPGIVEEESDGHLNQPEKEPEPEPRVRQELELGGAAQLEQPAQKGAVLHHLLHDAGADVEEGRDIGLRVRGEKG